MGVVDLKGEKQGEVKRRTMIGHLERAEYTFSLRLNLVLDSLARISRIASGRSRCLRLTSSL